MGKVTLKQIAEAAGVTTAAVSLALNHKKRISKETSDRIYRIIRELHYQPPASKKRIIAFIRARQKHVVAIDYLMRAAALRNECYQRNWQSIEIEEENLNIFNDINPDGAVIFTYSQETCKIFAGFSDVPLISFSAPSSHLNNVYGVHCVQHQQIVEYLLGMGHRRIGCITAGPEEVMKWEEVREKLHMKNFFIFQSLENDLSLVTGELLRKGVTAIHAQNFGDRMPRILALYGKRIPQDISLTIGDTPVAAYMVPSLTTAAMDYEAAARAIADGFESIWAGNPLSCDFEIPGRIIERESCIPYQKSPA